MKVSGYTFVRNAVQLSYPAVESIRSILPICDEFIVNVGESSDGTLELIKSIGDPKIKILNTTWNDNMRVRGFVYGQQKTIAQFNCTGHWAFYLECDEIVHESELDAIYKSMEDNLDDPEVEAFYFKYFHFYGNHMTYLDSPQWYRHAPRIIRNTIRAWAPGGLYFVVMTQNKRGRYPKAAYANASIYHYGWVRSEEQMNAKISQVQHYWSANNPEVNYENVDPQILRTFTGTHPAVMADWLPKEPTPFTPNPDYVLTKRDRRQRLKMKAERLFGIDLSHRNYIDLKR